MDGPAGGERPFPGETNAVVVRWRVPATLRQLDPSYAATFFRVHLPAGCLHAPRPSTEQREGGREKRCVTHGLSSTSNTLKYIEYS